MRDVQITIKILVAVSMFPGCGAEPVLHDATSALAQVNGENLNGQNLNGENLNGENLNGENLNGENLNGPNAGAFSVWTSLQGVVIDGTRLDDAKLAASVFAGNAGHHRFAGTDFTGAEFVAMRGDGETVTMRIATIERPTDDSLRIWRYGVEYLSPDGGWYPICGEGIAAIPLEGTWDHHQGVPGGGSHTADPTKFTFACENASLAKCVHDGYLPWRTRSGMSLADLHQACVRMLRADYCGQGIPYTQNGNLVNLYDAIGIQNDTRDWRFEAEWNSEGARCLTSARRATRPVSCLDTIDINPGCGDPQHFGAGTLLMNEIP